GIPSTIKWFFGKGGMRPEEKKGFMRGGKQLTKKPPPPASVLRVLSSKASFYLRSPYNIKRDRHGLGNFLADQ
ncbi:hypothetical protein M8355_17170, partial [Enterobacter hormaechei]|nr:hypothetical protein [Enterobacter hormaechei]